jgi:hypothetical protein
MCASFFSSERERRSGERWFGHHSPAFTLVTYLHLLGDDVGVPLSLDDELAGAMEGQQASQHQPKN